MDPEPLILLTPALATNDPRLMEQAIAWCEHHGEVISKTRLDGLKRLTPKAVGNVFETFAEALGGAAGLWGGSKVKAIRSSLVARSGPPPLERPALARLRMRALSGTGARADVLCELLGSTKWVGVRDGSGIPWILTSPHRRCARGAQCRRADE